MEPTCEGAGRALHTLPDEILQLILRSCSVRDLAAAAMTCKRLHVVARSDEVWRRKCFEDFGMSRSKVDLCRGNNGHLFDMRWRGSSAHRDSRSLASSSTTRWFERYVLCRHAIHRRASSALSYMGVATDGGCDGTEVLSNSARPDAPPAQPGMSASTSASADLVLSTRYSVANMFGGGAPSHWDSYCSGVGSANVHCFAFLQREPARDDEEAKELRDFIIMRTRHALCALYGPDADCELWTSPELEEFLVHLFRLFTHGSPVGNLLFVGVRNQEELNREIQRTRSYVEAIERSRLSPKSRVVAVGGDTSILSVPDVPSPVGTGSIEISLINKINVSRVGHFSCPVSCGAVLVGLATRSAETDTLNMLSAARTGYCAALSGLTSAEEVLAACHDGNLPLVRKQIVCSSGEYIEFDLSASDADAPGPLDLMTLRPLVWFRFITKEEANRIAEERVERGQPPNDRFDEMDITLSRHHAANALCAKLISAENHMEEFNDMHDSPNIDINSCAVSGVTLTMDMCN